MYIRYYEIKTKNIFLAGMFNDEKQQSIYAIYRVYTYNQKISTICLSKPAKVFKLDIFHFDTRVYHLCHEFTCIHHQNVKVTA